MLIPFNRLLFALKPPRPLAAKMGRARDGLGAVEGVVGDERLHSTLAITDDYADLPDDLVETMIAIGNDVAADPLPLLLDRLVGSTKSVALRPGKALPALREFQRQLERPMERRRILRRAWSFSPHVTLAYRAGQPFSQRVDTIGWEGDEFVLIHSIVGRTQHREVARWPLRQRQLALFH